MTCKTITKSNRTRKAVRFTRCLALSLCKTRISLRRVPDRLAGRHQSKKERYLSPEKSSRESRMRIWLLQCLTTPLLRALPTSPQASKNGCPIGYKFRMRVGAGGMTWPAGSHWLRCNPPRAIGSRREHAWRRWALPMLRFWSSEILKKIFRMRTRTKWWSLRSRERAVFSRQEEWLKKSKSRMQMRARALSTIDLPSDPGLW